ncbi:protein kinase C theta type-like [Eleutherodactylus coqui]|uniref:protein kinase C theta type-like n=1 Tax=Eleutherodactylus coqui TaxID=57060 RepID=UPI003461D4F6
MASIGHRGGCDKRKREEESESERREIKKKRSGENVKITKDEEPTPGTSQDPGPSDSGFHISRFTRLRTLGKGSFGEVVLASFPDRNTFTAIKIVDRGSEARMLLRERRILLKAQDCPFICHLYAAQQSANKVYFIMEYLSGGSLRAIIGMCGCLDISIVRFYTAEIVCGFQFLHQRNIVHRMATGKFPFYHGSIRKKVIKSITREQPQFPSWLDADIKHLLERLLCKNPEKRLGVYENIRAHPFFTTIDWEELEMKREQPPFKPFRRVLENENLQWPEDGTPLHPVDGFDFTSPSWTKLNPCRMSPEPTTLLL